MNKLIITAALAALLLSDPLGAEEARKVHVVATLPDVGAIARAIGGDAVEVVTLAKGYEDPHYVTPTPALMTAVANADLFLEIGLSLELWAERVLDGARNPKVRVGQDGHDFVSRGVDLLEVPTVVTREGGDLHPEGNPHIWLDPLNGLVMARNIRDALIRVAPDRADAFRDGYRRFEADLYETMYGAPLVKLFGGPLLARLDRTGKLLETLRAKKLEGEPLVDKLGGLAGASLAFRGQPIIFYHKSWIYFADRFGLEIRDYVEDKPGITPSAKRRDLLIEKVKKEGIPVIAVTNYYPRRVPDAIAGATDAKVVVLPSATGGVEGADDYLSFLKLLVGRLAEAYRGN
jgi:zinc/manganese transport system substrate-binding protein